MQQTAEWLKNLVMPEDAGRFAENRIDISVLPELTGQHLKDLGVALEDRQKMLRAIRDLSNVLVAASAPSTRVAPAARTAALAAGLPPTSRDGIIRTGKRSRPS